MKHKMEIFSADCPLCKETIKMVKDAECCKESEIQVHTCLGDECCKPAKNYKIKAVPTIVVDGMIAIEGKPTLQELNKIVGSVCEK